MALKETIYAYSPRYLRDVLVTLQGAQFAYQRYGGAYPALRRQYAQLERESPEQQRVRRNRLLAEFVRHAAERSPFYRELYRGIELPRTPEELPRLPVLTKSLLRENLERIRCENARERLISIHTSGTTGTPMEFWFLRRDFQERMAILDAWRAWFGVDHGMRRATFSGRVVVPSNADGGSRFWQTNYAIRQRLYSSYHLAENNLRHYVDDLNAYRPQFLDGYPSALWIVARYIRSRELPLSFKPKVVFTTAETLTPECRRDIEQAFRCPVRDQYASSEGAPFIVECESGRMHFLTYSGVMEVVDDQGRAAHRGRALFTAFHTRYMPLIRYDIGDSVELADEGACECGRSYPLVSRIIGREEDYLISSARGKIGRLDPIFKKLPPSIVRAQIVQHVVDEVEVVFVPDRKTFAPRHLALVESELLARLGPQARIRFKEVAEIPVGARGKLKAVVCTIKDA